MGSDGITQSAYTQAGTNTVEEQQRAAVTVAARATSPADCTELLAMLGLLTVPARPRKQGRPTKDHPHGTDGRYAKGCRCDQCRAANTRRIREQRERRKADPERADRAGHGKAATYQNYGCRCRPCTEANSARSVAYKTARRMKGAAA
ncbi:MAG: hypothetical protein HOY75_13460 [Streptomyces sp.]|nr:hypothetical protein [Streptomyces sp.]